MIVNVTHGDPLKHLAGHIAFAVNTDGVHDRGFAGVIHQRFWPELWSVHMELGKSLTKEVGPRHFHALCCHEIGPGGWKLSESYIERALDELKVDERQTIALMLPGTGPIELGQGALPESILGGIARSWKRVHIFFE